ncbi:MAG: AsmA family protein [Desulfobacterales bacterium]|jgi:AsmA protein
MKKALKWVLVGIVALALVVVAAIVAAVMMLDVDTLKPKIEKQVSDLTGRPFAMGSDLDPSFFPWIGVAVSDIALGNPEGFSDSDFLKIESLEARLKLLPLLRREIQVKRFVVRGPVLTLEKTNGKGNWAFGKQRNNDSPKTSETSAADLPIAALEVEEFAIVDGRIHWVGPSIPHEKTVSDINLKLTDVSLEQPIGIDFSATFDDQPIAVDGQIGPVGRNIGKAPLPLQLTVNVMEELVIKLGGTVDNLLEKPLVAVSLDIPEFSPKAIADRFQPGLLPAGADENALTRLSLNGLIKAGDDRFSLSDGAMMLDDSRIDLALDVTDISAPDIQLKLSVDRIDVDRYLPPDGSGPRSRETGAATEKEVKTPSESPTDDPLRSLTLDASATIGKLIVKRVRMEDLRMRLVGSNGVFKLDPLDMGMYGGGAQVKGTFDVRRSAPKTSLALNVTDVAAGDLLKDVSGKKLIEGSMAAAVELDTVGDTAESAKKSLNGGGKIVFEDGALIGIDLADMVRNVRSAFTGEGRPVEKPRTDFAEFSVPFTLKKGQFHTDGTVLRSPLLRLNAEGDADLVGEKLDFRVEPKVVASLKGQGDDKEREGLSVPVLVGGTFSSPIFRPDLESIARRQLEEKVLESDEVKKIFEKNENLKPLEEPAKGLLKNLLGPKN